MANRKIKAYRVIVFFDLFLNNFVYRFSKFFTWVVGFYFKTTDDQPLQLIQLPGSFEVPEHAVNTVQVFSCIFQK
ncbi:hypothetical protein D3C86_1902590 [compost metagenome]